MKVIKIDDFGTVQCGANETMLQGCDILGSYRVCGECGDCPLIKLHEQLLEIQFDGAIDELGKKTNDEERQDSQSVS